MSSSEGAACAAAADAPQQGPVVSKAKTRKRAAAAGPSTELRRLATQGEGGDWYCGCGYKFGDGVKDGNAKQHEDKSKRHRKWVNSGQPARPKPVKLAKPNPPKPITNFFGPAAKAPVASATPDAALTRTEEDSDEIVCLETPSTGVANPSPSESVDGSGCDMNVMGDNGLDVHSEVEFVGNGGGGEWREEDGDTGGEWGGEGGDTCSDEHDEHSSSGMGRVDRSGDSVSGSADVRQEPTVDKAGASSCPGFKPDFIGGRSPVLAYPFGLHRQGAEQPYWTVELRGEEIRFRAVQEGVRQACTGKSPSAGEPCKPCSDLEHSSKFRGLVSRAQLDATTQGKSMNNRYLGFTQLTERLAGWKRMATLGRLQTFNLTKRTKVLVKQLTLEKRITLLMSKENVGGVRRVLAQALGRGASSQTIVAKLEAALAGTYHARGWKEEEKDLALLVLRIGGPALLHVLQQTTGLPGLSYTRQYAGKIPFVGCASGHPALIGKAIRANVLVLIKRFKGGQRNLWKAATDEVAINQKAEWNPKDNTLMGFCMEHSKGLRQELIFENMGRVDHLKELLDTGRLHLGKEAVVITLAQVGSSNGHAIPLYAGASCKSSNESQQLGLFEEVAKAWRERMDVGDGEGLKSAHEVLGPLSYFASDGDALRRRAFVQLTSKKDFADFDYLTGLIGCDFMDRAVGEEGVVQCFDPKHLFKRIRERLKSERTGIKIGVGAPLQRAVLQELLQKHQPDLPLAKLFDPQDSQNVPATMKLVRALMDVGDADATNIPGLGSNHFLKARHDDVKVLTAFMRGLHDVLFNYKKNLSDLLEGLSCTAHIALFIYRQNQTAFLPGQLLHDLQATIRCAFIVVAQTKALSPSLLMHLFQLGTDNVENLFAVLRTMTHSRTFSHRELDDRLAHASQVEDIYGRYDGWRRKGTRLNTADHMNIETWKRGPEGNTSVGDVDLARCWQEGRRMAVSVLQTHPSYQNIGVRYFLDLADKPDRQGKVTMLYPLGEGAGMPGVGQSSDEDETPAPSDSTPPGASSTSTAAATGEARHETVADTTVDSGSVGIDELEVDCLLEPVVDALATGASTNVDSLVDVMGKQVHKTTVARLCLDPNAAPGSNDRARRVRGYGRGVSGRTASNLLTGAEERDDDVWASASIGQPFATFVQLATGAYSLCIFVLTRGVEPQEGGAQLVHGIRVRLRAGDGSDVGVWSWDGGKTHGSKEIRVPATLALPVNPDLNGTVDSMIFKLADLRAIFATLETIMEKTPDASSRFVKAGATSVDSLPYHHSLQAESRSPQPPSLLKCRACGREGIKIEDMRAHVSAHVLQAQLDMQAGGDKANAAKATGLLSQDTCGFCGRCGCTSFLRQGCSKKTFVCQSSCSDAPRDPKSKQDIDVALKVGVVRKGTKYHPCTNLPMACELCHGKTFRWKYSMRAHIDAAHGGVNGADGGGSEQFQASFAISDEERNGVLELLGGARSAPGTANGAAAGGAQERASSRDHGSSNNSRMIATASATVNNAARMATRARTSGVRASSTTSGSTTSGTLAAGGSPAHVEGGSGNNVVRV